MDRLPKEMIEHILEFHGFYKWRNGKYMAQLFDKDTRYNLLSKIPPIVKNKRGIYYSATIKNSKKKYYYLITTRIYGECIHWYMDLITTTEKKEPDCTYRYIHFINGR